MKKNNKITALIVTLFIIFEFVAFINANIVENIPYTEY